MSKVITRFAPSPTGNLHMGNIRIAILNWLFALQNNGEFILRIDDTDQTRCKEEFTQGIKRDLQWLNIKWSQEFHQKDRLLKYQDAKKQLKDRLYACYETPEELEIKRKLLLSSGKPFIYDRESLNLSQEQINKYISEGRKPHYRFLLKREEVKWNDMIRGEISYNLENISDPILIRNDGSFTYMLCSTVDDEEYQVSHVIRGEDHIINTAIQKQLIDALNYNIPTWGHISLIFDKSGKISKRKINKGYSYVKDIKSIIAPETLLSFLSTVGRSKDTKILNNQEELIKEFDINSFSKSNTIYDFDQIIRLNKKFLQNQEAIKFNLDNEFWNLIKMNIDTLSDIDQWKDILLNNKFDKKEKITITEDVIQSAIKLIPFEFSYDNTNQWFINIQKDHLEYKVNQIKKAIRIIITSLEHGPQIDKVLSFLEYDEVLRRLREYV